MGLRAVLAVVVTTSFFTEEDADALDVVSPPPLSLLLLASDRTVLETACSRCAVCLFLLTNTASRSPSLCESESESMACSGSESCSGPATAFPFLFFPIECFRIAISVGSTISLEGIAKGRGVAGFRGYAACFWSYLI